MSRAAKRVFSVAGQDAGARLEAFLAAKAGLDAPAVRAALEEGRVSIDGRRPQPGARLAAGSRVVLRLEGRALPPRSALLIRHRDADLLVVDKPAGLPVQPGRRGGDSLIDRLRAELAASERAAPRRGPMPSGRGSAAPYLGLMHRLDADASGLVLVTLSPEVNARLARAFREQRIERVYLALVAGRVDAPLELTARIAAARRGGALGRRRVLPAAAPAGQLASTRVRPLEQLREATLIEARLETGRTHQIRAQLAAAGHPLLGDRLYGNGPPGAPRLALHATRLELDLTGIGGNPGGASSPIPAKTGSGRLVVESPLPEELERWVERLRRAPP